MPDYRESTAEATSHRRAYAVHLQNPYERPEASGILFEEEDVMTMAGRTIRVTTGTVSSGFTPAATFPLLDPTTGGPTGATATHMDVYVMLNSLYIHLAMLRDEDDAAAAAAAAAAAEAQP